MDTEHGFYFTHLPPIRPYVCCTPKDFKEERHYLTRNIFPQLNQLCQARGTQFKAVDLRWPTQEVPTHSCPNFLKQHSSLAYQQLKLSLDYINDTCPFFICMLGQTYGEFQPANSNPLAGGSTDDQDLSRVERNLYMAARNGYPWVLQNQTCSLTELEIIQASFLKDSSFQYFYFRDYQYIEEKLQNVDEQEKERVLSTFASESDYEELRIRKLKSNIVNKGLLVRFFKDLQELGDLILKDWSDVIEELYPISSMTRDIG